MGFTQKEILEALKESGRDQWNLRQMTALRTEGFLPPLRRRKQPGTNKPEYTWEEEDIDQIADVYDWWSYCDGDRKILALALWLDGYELPLEMLRGIYLPLIDTFLQHLTHGETDPDDILDEVSKIVVVWMRKLKFMPGLTDQRKKMVAEQNMSIEQMEILTEAVLSALAVPDQVLAPENLYSSLSGTGKLSNDTQDDDFLDRAQDITEILHDIFTLPHLRETVETATPELWYRAREDYFFICKVLRMIEKRSTSDGGSSLPDDFLLNMKIRGAVWLITPLLSTRYRGYGQSIDMAFEGINKMLADPAVLESIRNRQRAKDAIETDIEDKEKPEIALSRETVQ